ncbi:hypothetical protein COCON_G00197390 [Conger conger]|uniref:Homeobox domain-containing protein n=1 Tax=Conger conger TaxID=82655 RepID=A0A9Q1HR46_CONCO|nr:hypothetical protein COCON_G00197390 [Conger conger]
MSSYIVNSKYVDPEFPPCAEYSQNSYIPTQDTNFQNAVMYSRSNYTEQHYSCNTVRGDTVQARGHAQEQPSQSSPFTARTEPCAPVQMSGPQKNTKRQTGITARQPAVVYAWMKKAHVTTVNPDYTGPEPKRARTAYTRQQALELEKEFHFNRRMKWKKDHKLPNTKGRSSTAQKQHLHKAQEDTQVDITAL